MSVNQPTSDMAIPPGLLQRIAEYADSSAHIPNWYISVYSAIAILSAVTGRAYNTYTGAGLNQYLMLLADTGSGKDHTSNVASALFDAIQPQVPSAADFRGPGHIASAPGLVKWLDRKPCVLSILSEISKRLPEWNSPRNPNGIAIQRTLLELYGRSGKGKTFDPSAYSDKEKNTGFIKSPSLTIAAEGVPGEFYSKLDEGLVSGGLLPRFAIFEYEGQRAYSNHGAGATAPNPALIQEFADLVGQCLNLGHSGNAHVVPVDDQAFGLLQSFDDETTDLINDGAEITKQLWNRAHLKALKLATLSAVSWNYLNPVVTYPDAVWGIALIRRQTERLITKFDAGEIGAVEGDEGKQTTEVLRIMRHYATSRWEQVAMYHGSADMHRDGVITKAHITQRLQNTAAFKSERGEKPTVAIKRVIDQLLSSDEIRQMPATQMTAKYGKHPEAYVVSDFSRIAKV